jgi:hypothetical protein
MSERGYGARHQVLRKRLLGDRYDRPATMPLDHGYELYRNKAGGDRTRAALSTKGERKRERSAWLESKGWTVKRTGVGHCTHPDHPEVATSSIAAACILQAEWDANV